MFKQGLLILILIVSTSGCANLQEYDPLAKTGGIYLLNQSGFSNLANGMSIDDVHDVMGQHLIIGYSLDPDIKDYTPQTIPNPFKAEIVKWAGDNYTVEYYATRITNPDGAITDDELIPLIFKDDKLIARGWKALANIKPAQ